MIPPCLYCPEASEDRHHLTSRDARGRYLDPDLTAPLCHSCHELVGDDWHTIEVQDESTADTFLASLEVRLTRTASFVGRLADAVPEPLHTFLSWLACHLATWAGQLGDSIRALDRGAPGWRALPGV